MEALMKKNARVLGRYGRAKGLPVGRATPPRFCELIRLAFRAFGLAPHARQPWLLLAWQSCWPVVVLELDEARVRQVAAPRLEIVVRAVAPSVPAFLVRATWIGAEQDAAGAERCVQLPENAVQLL